MVVRLASLLETLTGLALAVRPSMVSRLLLGQELAEPGETVGRIAGLALLALGVACWPETALTRRTPGLLGILLYNLLVTLFLLNVGIVGQTVGLLLWPAVAVHTLLTVLLAYGWRKSPRYTEADRSEAQIP